MLFSARVAAEWPVSVLDEACCCETTQASNSSSICIVFCLQPNGWELRLTLLSAKRLYMVKCMLPIKCKQPWCSLQSGCIWS